MTRKRRVVAGMGALVGVLAWLCGGLGPSGVAAQDVPDVKGQDILMVSYEVDTGLLAGMDRNGLPVAAYIAAPTRLRAAQVDKYLPTDPCKTLAEDYNASIASVPTGDATFGATMVSLASSGCAAKLHIDSAAGVARLFQPKPL